MKTGVIAYTQPNFIYDQAASKPPKLLEMTKLASFDERMVLSLAKKIILGTNIFTCKYTLKAAQSLPCHANLESRYRIYN